MSSGEQGYGTDVLAQQGDILPFTGAELWAIAAAGVILVAFGYVLMRIAARDHS